LPRPLGSGAASGAGNPATVRAVAVANWVWAMIFLVLTGVVVWGWAFDFVI
jgi:hypothetical protein